MLNQLKHPTHNQKNYYSLLPVISYSLFKIEKDYYYKNYYLMKYNTKTMIDPIKIERTK